MICLRKTMMKYFQWFRDVLLHNFTSAGSWNKWYCWEGWWSNQSVSQLMDRSACQSASQLFSQSISQSVVHNLPSRYTGNSVCHINVRCVSYIIIIYEFYSLSVSPSVGTIVPTSLSHQSFPCRLVYRTPKILLTYFEKRHTFAFSFTAWPITKGLVKQTTRNSE